MAIDSNGVFTPDSFETIRDEVQNKQQILGTSFSLFADSVYQNITTCIIESMTNLQTVFGAFPSSVQHLLAMQNTYIKRSPDITSDAITNKAIESKLIQYAQIFNKTDPKVACIFLYIYMEGIDYEASDLQYTANQIALITPVFTPYVLDENVTISKTYTCTVSNPSTIDVIFNIANAISIDVDIVTDPKNLGDIVTQLKLDFANLFSETQGIGIKFDESFYQRKLFIEGLSSMNYTATTSDCESYEILILGEVTVNGI